MKKDQRPFKLRGLTFCKMRETCTGGNKYILKSPYSQNYYTVCQLKGLCSQQTKDRIRGRLGPLYPKYPGIDRRLVSESDDSKKGNSPFSVSATPAALSILRRWRKRAQHEDEQ